VAELEIAFRSHDAELYSLQRKLPFLPCSWDVQIVLRADLSALLNYYWFKGTIVSVELLRERCM